MILYKLTIHVRIYRDIILFIRIHLGHYNYLKRIIKQIIIFYIGAFSKALLCCHNILLGNNIYFLVNLII
jgi:hypothetical protein